MANTFTSLHYHVVFSTHCRELWIAKDIQEQVWSYLGGIIKQNGGSPMLTGGMPDHVHLAFSLPPTRTINDIVKAAKGGSSKWIKERFSEMKGFKWQDGYAAFTISKSALPEVMEYIRNQAEHHRTKTFQEEYIAFLKRHEVEYDPKHVWG